tara:strand:- start:399 stop:1343 length:945 start_codon:yes stop_codon:yes gene_type:complete
MKFRADEIHNLLKAHAGKDPEVDDGPPTCDVVYALFLEPAADTDPRLSTLECVIDKAVRFFQPHPAMAHCELLVPPVPVDEGLRTQFATYLGRKSAWQTDKADGYNYYLVENAGRWRAVPIFQANAGAKLRNEADMELGVDYSLSRYLSAVPPGRWVANWLPDKRRTPAHCATLTARVLHNADVYKMRHKSSWYGPSTLYHELSHVATWKAERIGAASWEGMPWQTAQHVESLLRGVMSPETVHSVGDTGCLEAVRALTMRTCNALVQSDSVTQRLTQQQLATALLRWVVLRDLQPVQPAAVSAAVDADTADAQ